MLTLTGHGGGLECVAVFPDASQVVSSSWDQTAKIWQVDTGQCVRTLEGHNNRVFAVAVFPDGRRVVTGSWDRTAKIWKVSTGEVLMSLESLDRVRSVAVFPDGERVLAGCMDRVVRIWDAHTGENVQTLEGHNDTVRAVAILPDGEQVISGSNDCMAMIWSDMVRRRVPLQVHANKQENGLLTISCMQLSGNAVGTFSDIGLQEKASSLMMRIQNEVLPPSKGHWHLVVGVQCLGLQHLETPLVDLFSF